LERERFSAAGVLGCGHPEFIEGERIAKTGKQRRNAALLGAICLASRPEAPRRLRPADRLADFSVSEPEAARAVAAS
jgi:hypothetical protein